MQRAAVPRLSMPHLLKPSQARALVPAPPGTQPHRAPSSRSAAGGGGPAAKATAVAVAVGAPQSSAVPRAPAVELGAAERETHSREGKRSPSGNWRVKRPSSEVDFCWRVTKQLGVPERPRRRGDRAPAASTPAGRLNATR